MIQIIGQHLHHPCDITKVWNNTNYWRICRNVVDNIVVPITIFLSLFSRILGKTEDESQLTPSDDNKDQRSSSAQKFRRSFHKYTGTVIRSPLDRINQVTPPRRLLRNDFTDGYESRTKTCNSTLDMIELTPIQDESRSVDTCSTTTNGSIKGPYYDVLI